MFVAAAGNHGAEYQSTAIKMARITVEKLSEGEIAAKGIRAWPVWTKEVSEFPYTYDETEACLFLEGEVVVKTAEGEVHIGPGDYVVFPEGLSCTWCILKDVKKHYHFG